MYVSFETYFEYKSCRLRYKVQREQPNLLTLSVSPPKYIISCITIGHTFMPKCKIYYTFATYNRRNRPKRNASAAEVVSHTLLVTYSTTIHDIVLVFRYQLLTFRPFCEAASSVVKLHFLRRSNSIEVAFILETTGRRTKLPSCIILLMCQFQGYLKVNVRILNRPKTRAIYNFVFGPNVQVGGGRSPQSLPSVASHHLSGPNRFL